MSFHQFLLRIHQDIDLYPDAIACVVCHNAFDTVNKGAEAISKEEDFLSKPLIGSGSREANDVFE
jgi:hypothetical protein